MPKEYKPERPITSAKLREFITEKFDVSGKSYKRLFKKRLVISRGWVRGYTPSYKRLHEDYKDVIVILDIDDTKIIDIYMVDDCVREATSLGIDEILTSE